MPGTLSINSLAFSLENTAKRISAATKKLGPHVLLQTPLGICFQFSIKGLMYFRDLNMIDYKKTKMLPFLILIFMCMGITCAVACRWPSKDCSQDSVLSFHAMDSGNQSRSIASWLAPLPAKPSLWPLYFNINNFM